MFGRFGVRLGVLCFWVFLVGFGRVASAAPTQLVMWHAYRAEERRALEAVIQQFHKQQDKIRVRLLAIPYDAYADKISAAIPRGHGPDLFIFAHDRIGDWAKNKILEPITFWVDGPLLSRFFPKTVQMLAYKNALYGLPLAYKSLALFYNTALVKKPPRTTKEMIALAQSLTDHAKRRFGLAYEASNFYHHAAWVHGFGGRVFKGGKVAIDSDASVKAMAFAYDLQKKYKLLPAEPTSQLISSLFNTGQVAMVLNGPWFRGEIESRIQYAVVPMPMISETGKPAAPFLTSEAVLLSRKSKHKRLAFEVMKYLTSKASAMVRMTVGKQPVANRVCYATPEAKKDPILLAFRKQLDHTVPMDNTPAMRVIWAPMLNALGNVFRGQMTAKKALEAAKREILGMMGVKK
ncbi:MAG: extracellular solute-binding protein [Myxococcales bacterium]|nr:extracellular solute-binding protein [Myxococcales bacterium]